MLKPVLGHDVLTVKVTTHRPLLYCAQRKVALIVSQEATVYCS